MTWLIRNVGQMVINHDHLWFNEDNYDGIRNDETMMIVDDDT